MHKKFIFGLGVMAVFLILFISSIFSSMYNLRMYDQKYRQYGVYDRFSEGEAMNATSNLLGYLKTKEELDKEFFNDKEEMHLYDVREILDRTSQIYYASIFVFWLIILIAYLLGKDKFFKFFSELLIYAGSFTISIIILLGLLYVLLGFDFLFQKFHELLFTGNFSFDPRFSNLKALFPDEFFNFLLFLILSKIMVKSIFLIGSGYFFMKKFK